MNFIPYIDIAARSVAVYIFIVIAIRLFGKKELAQLSVVDLVFILLISNSVQNAMVGPSTSLTGGLVAALVLFSVNFIFKKIIYKHKNISEFIQGKSVVLIYEGKMQHHNLKEVEITYEELQAAIREHGILDIEYVKLAMLEVDGNISIIANDYNLKILHQTKNKHKIKGRILKL
jgi:uncharacterized membrane protein YcaP (DUF421 family)